MPGEWRDVAVMRGRAGEHRFSPFSVQQAEGGAGCACPVCAGHALADPDFFMPPTPGSTTSGLPVFDWNEAAAQLARDGSSWTGVFGQPVTVSYAFRDSGTVPDFSDISGFMRYTAAQIVATEEALRFWSDVANISFVRVGSGTTGPHAYSDNATMLFGNFVTGPDTFTAFAYLPDPAATAAQYANGDVWSNGSRSYMADPLTLPLGARILLHEIGHTLGILHPSIYDGGAGSGRTYEADADYYQDTHQFTAMSYFSEGHTGAYFGTAVSIMPMMHDIAAAQLIYGVNTTTRTGNTTYGFNSNAGHAAFSITSSAQNPVFCIWDGGGIDTLDLTGFTTASLIDLREESFSSAGMADTQLIGNISIARGAVIENASGGHGDDTIVGNGAVNMLAGNDGADLIFGNSGNDILDGGPGFDHLEGGPGADLVMGGAGFDTAVYLGTRGDFEILRYGTIIATLTVGVEGLDRLNEIEQLQFSDITIAGTSTEVFSPYDYLAAQSDVLSVLGANLQAAFDHYVDWGFEEGRSRNFDSYDYLASHIDLISALGGDVAAAGRHYVEWGVSEGRERDDFANFDYLASHIDLIAALGANPQAAAEHYVNWGFGEGRAQDTFPNYDYLASNADLLVALGANVEAAAEHYVRWGLAEGRLQDDFSNYDYIASHPDLIIALSANAELAAEHFVKWGFMEGRAKDTFDATRYLANYADLQVIYGDDQLAATLHFINWGYHEGRTDDPLMGG